jgi:hypothetical protein
MCSESSEPIKIPIKTKVNNKYINMDGDDFEMSAIIFDPSKSSPPNNWNSRLSKRIALFSQITDQNFDNEK